MQRCICRCICKICSYFRMCSYAPPPLFFYIRRTLNTIPALRSIANDVVLDVLLYLTPNYCYDVLRSVTDQIFSVYGLFNKTFPDFASRGGKFSLIGHSLGSVICWDLLSLKKNSMHNGDNEHGVQIMTSKTSGNAANINYEQFSNEVELADNHANNKFTPMTK